jgi:predicted DNA-binding transcriptional regulator YafY
MQTNIRLVVDRTGPEHLPTYVSVDTPARLLRLLATFSARPRWRATDLAARLEITERTLRRDISRLRTLGYPVTSMTGPYGGYELGAGGRLPPLLLDDEEAIAVSIALRDLSTGADPVLGEAALAALSKLGQVLPPVLRERVAAMGAVTVGVEGPLPRFAGDEPIRVPTLMEVVMACRRAERLRFTYRDGNDRVSERRVEPHRVVSLRARWYLVGFDLDRDDWRTFRVDRISEPFATGHRIADREPPDAATLVAEGVAVRRYDTRARVRLHAPPAEAAERIPATVGIIEPAAEGATTTVVTIGGEADWIARYLAGLPISCEVIEPDEVRRELRSLARRLLREHHA